MPSNWVSADLMAPPNYIHLSADLTFGWLTVTQAQVPAQVLARVLSSWRSACLRPQQNLDLAVMMNII